ncbi:MAG: hypothetical protein U0354_10070 [Candidatus Sericytochromatia bacterium]
MSKDNKVNPKSSSQNKVKTTSNKSTLPQQSGGNEVDANYLKAFYPKPSKGMKWVYAMTINIQGMTLQGEMTMEVVDIVGEEVKIKISVGTQSHEEKVHKDAFAPIPNASGKKDSTGYFYESQENLNLPFKSLETVKLSTINNNERTFLWLSQGLGPVKFGISHGGIPANLELKAFS